MRFGLNMDHIDIKKKPSILFTNLFLAARSGSELHVLELAKAFLAKGWDVTCYTLVLAYPLQDQFVQAGISVIRFGEEKLLENHYTVLYAQHHIVSDYIWDCTTITFDKIVVASLGPQAEHEKLPSFSQNADLQVFTSYETLEHNHLDNPEIPTHVFPNSVERPWFDCASRRSLPKTPRRIAIISNHVAQELKDLKATAKKDLCVDCYGYENCSVEVTSDLITSYDLVISIGRTVPLCFATRIPLYCYDVHGGPGYIDPNAIEFDSFFNFSGRSNPCKRNAVELLDDIVTNYESAVHNLDALHQYASEHLNFTNNFEELYRAITSCKAHPHLEDRDSTELTKINRKNQCEAFIDSYSKTLGVAQLFFSDQGEPVSEANSTSFHYCYHTEIDASGLIRRHERDGACIRFDPDIHPVICTVLGDSNISPLNRERSSHKGDIFLTNDPIYLGEMQRLRFHSSPLSETDYWFEHCRIKTLIEDKERQVEKLNNELKQAVERIREYEKPLPEKLLKRIKSGLK